MSPAPHFAGDLSQRPEWFTRLRDLALNLRWTWDRDTRALFRDVSPALWSEIEDNPWLVLRVTPQSRLEALFETPAFRERLESLHSSLQAYLAEPGWFAQAHPDEQETLIAYFTAECGLTECLPFYAGGLGILAGDHLKAASALGVSLAAVTLMYQQGYSRQTLDAAGWQLDRFPSNSFEIMPLRVERNAEGWPLTVDVPLPGRSLRLLVWSARVGRASLYLLDANIPTNSPSDRGITSELYGGDREMRLQQEMALGIGGWRALRALGLRPQVCHLNEGHAAFALLERARALREDAGCTFWEALVGSVAGNVFTTHTPVPAGFDVFPPDLIARYVAPYADELGISVAELLGLGRDEPRDASEPFNMALLALRHVHSCNGVSRLHAEVSRRLFRPWFPRFPDREILVDAVTNGIHTDSWLGEDMDTLLKRYVAADVDERPERVDWAGAAAIPDGELWACLTHGRRRLVEFARERLRGQFGQRGIPEREAALRSESLLDPEVLTIGFARRFAAYKRPTLLFHDPDRLARLLLDPARPVQIVIAGKAHPDDDEGKALIQDVFRFSQREDVRHRVVFIEDYDMQVTGRMVQGVDVWLNTPRRPFEASGTSGMKVLPNGGLNLSVQDGWWAEAFETGAGWTFGTEQEDLSPNEQDTLDADQLYELLEREIVPLFYQRDPDGLPHGWLDRVKASMTQLCPRFNTNRMVRDYVEGHYLPAAACYRARIDQGLSGAKSLADWEFAVRSHWSELGIDRASVERAGGALRFAAQIRLGSLRPEDLAVQFYAEPLQGGSPEIVPLTLRDSDGTAARYEGRRETSRPAEHFTLRVLPRHSGVRQPLEVPLILWAG